MRRRGPPCLLFAGAGLLALAAPASAADPRLVTHAYNGDEVVRIGGRTGVQAVIVFAEDERIENVAVGDSSKWQITPNKRADLLFVKPLTADARTNMTVVTDRHTYFFDLVASPKARPVYMLRFTYPHEAKEKAQPEPAQAQAGMNDAERQAIDTPPVDPAKLNFAWVKHGSASLMPQRVYDDGNATYLLWGAKQQVPAILVRDEKGEEGPVNYAVRGSTIVIGDVPDVIVLRSGKAHATLEHHERKPEVAATASARTQGR